MRNISDKIAGLGLLVLVVGFSVIIWSRLSATGGNEQQHASRIETLSPDQMHRARAAPLSEQKYFDRSFVYSVER